jgi:transcriptional regulator with XRE-family HTH domain
MTLHQCEKLSQGAIKAVVLGSYERGTRAISLSRLQQLADLYEVPIQYFFAEKTKSQDATRSLIFDLRRVRRAEQLPERILPIKRYLSSVARKRSDWNGEVLSLRQSDSQSLALICEMEEDELFQELRLAGLLFASEVSGQRSL